MANSFNTPPVIPHRPRWIDASYRRFCENPDLDPRPWVSLDGQYRSAEFDGTAIVFSPYEGFEQDRSKYTIL